MRSSLKQGSDPGMPRGQLSWKGLHWGKQERGWEGTNVEKSTGDVSYSEDGEEEGICLEWTKKKKKQLQWLLGAQVKREKSFTWLRDLGPECHGLKTCLKLKSVFPEQTPTTQSGQDHWHITLLSRAGASSVRDIIIISDDPAIPALAALIPINGPIQMELRFAYYS